MDSKLFFAILLIFTENFQVNFAQNETLSCQYYMSGSQYLCQLTIYNPNGLNNFQGVSGTHLAGKTDNDVVGIYRVGGSITRNVPSIICDQFNNLLNLYIDSIGIQKIDENSFRNCKKVTYLTVYNSNINEVHPNAFIENSDLQVIGFDLARMSFLPDDLFINQHNLQVLWLNDNKFQVLPRNILQSPTNLTTLYLQNNNLTVIHSDSFSVHPKLAYVDLGSNKINAIDERFIDNVGVQVLNMYGNVCANKSIIDSSTTREVMRAELKTCFENYEKLMAGTTTVTSTTITDTPTSTVPTTTSSSNTLPPGCPIGNLDYRVCRIENENEEFNENIRELRTENQRLALVADGMREEIDELKSEKEEMRQEMENQNKFFTAAIDDLQNQIYEITSNPCACR